MLEPTTVYTPSPNRYDSMTYNHAGESGLKLPAISLGFWHNFGDTTPYDTMRRIVFTAFDNGITHFDLANNYGPEPGSAEKTADDSCTNTSTTTATNSSSAPKPATKCGPAPTATSAAANTCSPHSTKASNASTSTTWTSSTTTTWTPSTPLEETMGALATAVSSGKALYVGLSNYDGPHTREGHRHFG